LCGVPFLVSPSEPLGFSTLLALAWLSSALVSHRLRFFTIALNQVYTRFVGVGG